MKSPRSTTSDTLNVILISQSQSEPPLFNLSSPPFLFSFFFIPLSFTLNAKPVRRYIILPDTELNCLHILPIVAWSDFFFLILTRLQCCVSSINSSALIYYATLGHNTFTLLFFFNENVKPQFSYQEKKEGRRLNL